MVGRVGGAVRRAAPFGLGIVAALIAVSLYGAFQTKPHVLDQSDVNRSIASALASMTPPPAVSLEVYKAVAPSLVLVEAQQTGTGSESSPGASPSDKPVTSPGPQASNGVDESPAPEASAVLQGSAAPDETPAPAASASPAETPWPWATPSGKSTALDGSTGTTVGAGVIVDDTGDIMTALHVVANAASIEVTFADGTKSTAEIADTDDANDIAVLQADQPPATITPAVLGDPRSMQVGSEAFVLGNPFGLEGSFSSGVVSGLDRSYQMPDGGPTLSGLIQVDAAVNPGSSGGPLVNGNGQVVGIVTALINPTNENVFIGIGLAVPIDVAASGGLGQEPQY